MMETVLDIALFPLLFQTFFERPDQKRLQEYLNNGQDILKQLEPGAQMQLKDMMTKTEERWKVCL